MTRKDGNAERNATLKLLAQNPDFLRLWLGQLLSQIGDRAFLIATLQLVNQMSDSVTALLIPALAFALPQVLFGLVGGVMADRWNRKHTMIISEVTRGLIVLSLLTIQYHRQLWILYLGVAALAFVGVFFYPARNALLPNIVSVGDLWSANTLIQGSAMIAMVFGPALAGIAVGLWGVGFAFIFDAVTFFLSATAIASLQSSGQVALVEGAQPRSNLRQEMHDGLKYIMGHQLLKRVLALIAMATLGIASIVLLSVRHLDEALGVGATGYGFTLTVLGIGALLGGLSASRLNRVLKVRPLVSVMLLIAGVAIIGFAYAPTYAIVLVCVALLGMSVVTARGALDTITQVLAPDEMRGRVQAAVNLIISAATALAEGMSALLGDLLGLRVVFTGAGIITLLAGFAGWRILRAFSAAPQHGRAEESTAIASPKSRA